MLFFSSEGLTSVTHLINDDTVHLSFYETDSGRLLPVNSSTFHILRHPSKPITNTDLTRLDFSLLLIDLYVRWKILPIPITDSFSLKDRNSRPPALKKVPGPSSHCDRPLPSRRSELLKIYPNRAKFTPSKTPGPHMGSNEATDVKKRGRISYPFPANPRPPSPPLP